MTESVPDSGPEIPTIELPSALRIKQRLGMIATSKSYNDELVPSIAQLGGQAMAPRELIYTLETMTFEYAEKHLLGMARFVQNGIPEILDSIVDDTHQKELALSAWKKRVKEVTSMDEATARQIQLRHTRGKTRVPRKVKKAQRRGSIAWDPSRNNNR